LEIDASTNLKLHQYKNSKPIHSERQIHFSGTLNKNSVPLVFESKHKRIIRVLMGFKGATPLQAVWGVVYEVDTRRHCLRTMEMAL